MEKELKIIAQEKYPQIFSEGLEKFLVQLHKNFNNKFRDKSVSVFISKYKL